MSDVDDAGIPDRILRQMATTLADKGHLSLVCIALAPDREPDWHAARAHVQDVPLDRMVEALEAGSDGLSGPYPMDAARMGPEDVELARERLSQVVDSVARYWASPGRLWQRVRIGPHRLLLAGWLSTDRPATGPEGHLITFIASGLAEVAGFSIPVPFADESALDG